MNSSKINQEYTSTNKCLTQKKESNHRLIFIVFLSLFSAVFNIQTLIAQDDDKNKVRLSVNYTKVMEGECFLDIKAISRIDKQNVEVPNIDLIISNEFDDETVELGSVKTNMEGKVKFIIKKFANLKPDSTNTYNLLISFKGNDAFTRASKSLSFKNVDIEVKLVTKDSVNYIAAKLIDKSTDSAVVGESLSVQVERLFKALRIGKEFNYTDENGTILVPIEEGIPGIDGNLIIEVVLKDHDDFGTVKAIVNTPIGIPIVEESTFYERTLWSPRNKTPIFILIFTGVMILGIWGIIIYLITNLFKINNAKS